MLTKQPKTVVWHDPDTLLEELFIDEYLRGLGCDRRGLRDFPEEVTWDLRAAASTYASDRLAEIEARAGLVKEVHGVTAP